MVFFVAFAIALLWIAFVIWYALRRGLRSRLISDLEVWRGQPRGRRVIRPVYVLPVVLLLVLFVLIAAAPFWVGAVGVVVYTVAGLVAVGVWLRGA